MTNIMPKEIDILIIKKININLKQASFSLN